MRLRGGVAGVVAALLIGSRTTKAISLDVNSTQSIKDAAASVAADLMSYYTGNLPGYTPGWLPAPYYWWQCGAMFGSLIDYWFYTGDTTYNDILTQGMLHQVGQDQDYMPQNASKQMGNDDQCFWALSAMSAAENKFKDPAPDQPQWLALAQEVFWTQTERWGLGLCGGGLKWQVNLSNQGYHYKNTISNGCFFNLASRLAIYTDEPIYAEWAEKTWDWMTMMGMVDAETYFVYDGVHEYTDSSLTTEDCKAVNRAEFSYNSAIVLLGAANLYNYTKGAPKWLERTQGLVDHTLSRFFENGVMKEISCESLSECSDANGQTKTCQFYDRCSAEQTDVTCVVKTTCNQDMRSFKAYTSRWLAATTKMAPFTYDAVIPSLRASAAAAAAQCNGPPNGRTCALRWTQSPVWHEVPMDENGVVLVPIPEQMAVLETIQTNLVEEVSPPVTSKTGGTSNGTDDPGNAAKRRRPPPQVFGPPTTGEMVGAAFITAFVILIFLGGIAWMILDDVRDVSYVRHKGESTRKSIVEYT